MARKTIAIDSVITHVNGMLKAPDGTPEGRQALAVLLDTVLMESDVYAGYSYQSSEFGPDSHLRNGYDETRRFYFTSWALR